MDFKQRLEQGRLQQAGISAAAEPDDDYNTVYFAMGRGYTPVCLELRLSNGSRRAFPYNSFVEITFEANAGIALRTSQKCITITGRNLAALFDRLLTYRIRYVQADLGNDTQEDGLFVDEICIAEL